MLRIGALVLGVEDVRRAAALWTQALGYQVREGGAAGYWTVLAPVVGAGPNWRSGKARHRCSSILSESPLRRAAAARGRPRASNSRQTRRP